MLVWNREITDGHASGFDPQASLANLDLHLHESTNFATHTLLDTSTSMVDNVEHIYIKNLSVGQYAIEVEAHDSEEYALAWFSKTALIPVISTVGDRIDIVCGDRIAVV